MKLLSVDTATEACSAALWIDGECSQRYQLAPREHSHLILKMIDSLLADAGIKSAGLDCLAFGRGPGSFMGIRIAAGVVQGIGFAHELPVVPVSTLKALALNAHTETGDDKVLVAIDARMKEVYWAAYEWDAEGQPQCVIDEAVCPPDQVVVPEQDIWLGAGTGWDTYEDILKQRCRQHVGNSLPDCFPSAAAIAELAAIEYPRGGAVTAAAAVPVYLRDNVAAKPKNKQVI